MFFPFLSSAEKDVEDLMCVILDSLRSAEPPMSVGISIAAAFNTLPDATRVAIFSERLSNFGK